MPDEEVEWLDEPVLPGPSDEPRRRRRPVVLVVGSLVAVAIAAGALFTGRDDRGAQPTPSAVATVTLQSPSYSWTRVVTLPEPSPGLLRAVGERFRGADLTTVGTCTLDEGASYGFAARGLTIQLDVGCGATDEDTDLYGPHRTVVNGPRARVSIASSPRRTLTERDFAAAERLIADERIAS